MPKATTVLAFLLLLLFQQKGDSASATNMVGVDCRIDLIHKVNARKLLVNTHDYDFGRPNTKHDPKKGGPGPGGKSSP